VWAFEPSRRELDRLQFNLDLNHLSAHVYPLALADTNGHAELVVAGYEHEGQNTLGDFAYQGVDAARRETVQLACLDSIVEQNPLERLDVIKADVEGAELKLFRGGVATMRRYRPVLLFEVSDTSLRHQGDSRENLLDFLRAQEYDLYAFDRHTGLPVPAVPGASSDNMIGVPVGKPLPQQVFESWPEP